MAMMHECSSGEQLINYSLVHHAGRPERVNMINEYSPGTSTHDAFVVTEGTLKHHAVLKGLELLASSLKNKKLGAD